ncbi:putative anaphase-promoting complex subunit 2 [Triangularia verruculosa]|uniref:Anaphase-promoting complex subunit 2 n=1 Tax=Triangularia verruculosa TaxID=2587418 RepID=A0AAN6XAB7_9PEZI|nr:putative anaphase-promoting complex subunit 2 [Triangularia verruculosa]
MAGLVMASPWRQQRRKRIFQSVFSSEASGSTAGVQYPELGQGAFISLLGSGVVGGGNSGVDPYLAPSSSATLGHTSPSPPPLAQPQHAYVSKNEHQRTYDQAWQIVTARVALPASATGPVPGSGSPGLSAQSSPGAPQPPPPSRQRRTNNANDDKQFLQCLSLLANVEAVLPEARERRDVIGWYVSQVRAHFATWVVPLLAGGSGTAAAGGAMAGGEGQGAVTTARRHHQRNKHSVDSVTAAGGGGDGNRDDRGGGSQYDRHMVVVMSMIKTLEGALGMYFQGLNLLLEGLSQVQQSGGQDNSSFGMRFRRDIHALIANSASQGGVMGSVKVVLTKLAGVILGVEELVTSPGNERGPWGGPPAIPADGDLKVLAARRRLAELVKQLHNVGLTGEKFEVLFAEVVNNMMARFVKGAFSGVWGVSDADGENVFGVAGTVVASSVFTTSKGVGGESTVPAATSACIRSLKDWIENRYAQLNVQVLSWINATPMSLADHKTCQSLALGRLAALRIQELFDIVLAWPDAKGALEDLKATITTTARRKLLTANFSKALEQRLLHPGSSTLEILQTYIHIIKTFHALDHSKVLLGNIEPSLQLYLVQREDSVRVVVAGLLASNEEIEAATKVQEVDEQDRLQGAAGGPEAAAADIRRREIKAQAYATPGAAATATYKTPTTRSRQRRDINPSTPAPAGPSGRAWDRPPIQRNEPLPSRAKKVNKLVELAKLLNESASVRRAAAGAEEDHELDWNDLNWVPDPVDAGANYKRPKSEDVIGTLISALGAEDVFINEFTAVIAERLLGEPKSFEQEMRVLNLLKRRFGDAALQNCDVMIRDIQESRKLNSRIRKWEFHPHLPESNIPGQPLLVTPGNRGRGVATPQPQTKEKEKEQKDPEYHARILSRLYWPPLEREHFLLPAPIVELQERYAKGYESLKLNRKLTWLNQLGQTRVELELEDRTVTVDCDTVQATVIHAFQSPDSSSSPVKKAVDDLYLELQLDEDLIAAACEFWTRKKVLRKVGMADGGEFVVMERLSDETAAAQPAETGKAKGKGKEKEEGAVLAPKEDAAKRLTTKEKERREVYWRYIQGMLTNSSVSMPLGQMAMMMGVLVVGGFQWSKEELQEFLGEKVGEGALEVVSGGKYKLVRK